MKVSLNLTACLTLHNSSLQGAIVSKCQRLPPVTVTGQYCPRGNRRISEMTDPLKSHYEMTQQMQKGLKYTLKGHARVQDSLHASLNVPGECFASGGYRNAGDATVCKQECVNELILLKVTASNKHTSLTKRKKMN